MKGHRHEPRGRDHELCLCGCGVSLEGMRADARYATEACKYRGRRRRPLRPTGDVGLADEVHALKAAAAGILQCWSDFTSQEMYGEMMRDGMETDDFDNWEAAHDRLRAALRGEP